jgi:hypothetical protein
MPRGVTLFDEQLIQGRVDSDALTYISKVERTDGASLEPGIKVAINEFVVNCKAFGLWDKLSMVGIFAGARTIDGARLALKGPQESFAIFNFVQSDYDRRNGFTGDGSTKYLTTGPSYLASDEPLDDYHIAANLTVAIDTAAPSAVWGFGGTNYDNANTHNNGVQSRSTSVTNVGRFALGFCCVSRDNSSNFDWRNDGYTTNHARTSVASNASGFRILRVGGSGYSTNTINYFSGGKSIPLALYDNLVTTLLADIARAVN